MKTKENYVIESNNYEMVKILFRKLQCIAPRFNSILLMNSQKVVLIYHSYKTPAS